jgi:hypothetical protein
LLLLDQVSGCQEEVSLAIDECHQACRSQSHSSNSKEAKTFSRCCSRLMGRMIVVENNENDLDYPCSMRFRVGGDKIAQRPHI